jgi:1,4-alpha-glucan branching enzyme
MSVAAEMKVDHPLSRHLAIGAEIVPEGGVHFRVWAPDRKNVDVILESENHAPGQEVCSRLQPENDGYFAGHVAEAHAGARYRFRLDGGPQRYPDPASRFQPEGPHGPSEVIDPFDFKWTDKNWNDIGLEGQVIYEMHIGTFSKEGTWEAAERELNELADSGITVLEVMPLAMFLLAPQTPMLFQGQEFAASTPFFYFVDQKEEIARKVAKGRALFLAQFRVLATPEMQARLPDPGNPMTFVQSKLDHNERRLHAEEYAVHRDLLRIRRDDSTFHRQRHRGVDGAVLGAEAFLLRFFAEGTEEDRLLVVNLGRDLLLDPAPEPLLAPPQGASWIVMWASEDPHSGGSGMPTWPAEGCWHLQGEAAIVLRPKHRKEELR